MRISDWSSDVCSSDLSWPEGSGRRDARPSLSTSRHDADGIGEAVSAPLAVLDRGIGVGIGGVYRRREGIEHEPADRLGLGTLDEDLAVLGARTLEAAEIGRASGRE